MLTIEEMCEMTYQGHHYTEHQQAKHHRADKQLIYDLLCLTDDANRGSGNPYAVAIEHAYKIGKIAGIKQERQRRKKEGEDDGSNPTPN